MFVSRSEPTSVLDGVIDYWVEWDCDDWVRDLGLRGYLPAVRLIGRGKDNPIDLTEEDAGDSGVSVFICRGSSSPEHSRQRPLTGQFTQYSLGRARQR